MTKMPPASILFHGDIMHIGQRFAFLSRHPQDTDKNFIHELKARCRNDPLAMCRQVIGNDDQFRSLLAAEHDFRKWLGIDSKGFDYARRAGVPLLALAKAAVLADNPRKAERALLLLQQVAAMPWQAAGTDFAEAVAYLKAHAGRIPEFKDNKAKAGRNQQLADFILDADNKARQRLQPSAPSTARLLQLRPAGGTGPNVTWERKTDPDGPSPIQNDVLMRVASNVSTGSYGAVSFFKDGTGKQFIGKTLFHDKETIVQGDTLGYELQAHEALHAWARDHAKELSEKDRIALSNIPKAYGIADVNGKRTLLMELIPGKKEGVEAFQYLYFHWQEGHISSAEYWSAIQFLARRLFDMTNLLAKANVIHNDIKPENIMIDIRTGEPKLIDFGGWSKIDGIPETFTVDYAAPEILKDKREDRKSTATGDAHSVGRTILAGVNGDMGRNDATRASDDFGRLRPVEHAGTAYRQFLDNILSGIAGDRLVAQYAEFLTESVLDDEAAKGVIKDVLTETTTWHKEQQRKRDSGENRAKYDHFLAAPSSLTYQELLTLAHYDKDLFNQLHQRESREAVIYGVEQEYQELLDMQQEVARTSRDHSSAELELAYKTKAQAFLRRVDRLSRDEADLLGISVIRRRFPKGTLDALGASIGANARGRLYGPPAATSDRLAASSYADTEELRADTESLITTLGGMDAQARVATIEQRLTPEKLQQIVAYAEELQGEMRRMSAAMAGSERSLPEYVELRNELESLQTILAPVHRAQGLYYDQPMRPQEAFASLLKRPRNGG